MSSACCFLSVLMGFTRVLSIANAITTVCKTYEYNNENVKAFVMTFEEKNDTDG